MVSIAAASSEFTKNTEFSERSHVSCRFASWRVANSAFSAASLQRAAIFDEVPELPVADRTHGRAIAGHTGALAQAAQLLDEAVPDHLIETLRNALMEQFSWFDREPDLQVIDIGWRQRRVLVPVSQRPAACPVDFQSPLNPLAVVRVDAAAGNRVDSPQLRMQAGPAGNFCLPVDFLREFPRSLAAFQRCLPTARGSRVRCRRPAAEYDLFAKIVSISALASRANSPAE